MPPEKADFGNPERDLGICPASLLPEMLKSCMVLGRFRPDIDPENPFSSRRRVRRWVKRLTSGGIAPEKLL